MTGTVTYRRQRLTRGWLDLYRHADAGAWGLAWARTPANPIGRDTRTRRKTTICPATYPDPADAEALVDWGRKHFGP